MKTFKSFLSIVCLVLVFAFNACTKDNGGNVNGNNTVTVTGSYSVFAWNDLGMHCLNPTYDKAVILPPYNNLLVQVVKRGAAPEIVTSGITVSYSILNNTSSYGKRSYGGFWDNAQKLFGVTLAHNTGLKGNGLSGTMTAVDNHFIVEGIPVVPVDDGNKWNPYQIAEVVVKDGSGNTLATTRATVPTSDEINCAKCHGTSTTVFDNILSKHDAAEGTSLSTNKPVLCASCHPSPALGITTGPQMYLSKAIHGFHATKSATCYDCHPGTTTKCNRSLAHNNNNAADGNCITCHGDMANVASSITGGRTPWASEPACVTCHTGVTGVSTGSALYRNSKGHGSMYCSACHGSPHSMYPSREDSDNYQPKQYQSSTKIKTLGSCGYCHSDSRGEGASGEFTGVHGGTTPEKSIGCRACHTSISTSTSSWPHAYTWKNSN
ncbi:MAG: multiheme c-type cytochrome [Bacteroidia bacterium]|nr:multiheme c-type cytochrome [Bacteroidia bacterium]